VLYTGPPFDVEMIYAAPTYTTNDSTTVVGRHALSISVSVASGVNRTTRKVTIQRIHGRDRQPQYVVGFCHLRQGERHFRVDRIREVRPAGTSQQDHLDPSAYLRHVIVQAQRERPEAGFPEAEVTPAGSGTVRVNQRDRKLKRRTEYDFYLGREEFDADLSTSPNGRYLTGVSQGNVEVNDPKSGVALVDTRAGVSPFVLRFRERPRWPRVNDDGLLLAREVTRSGSAILHVFDPEGRCRWSVNLPMGRDLAEFSSDGQLGRIISGLFWRSSDADVPIGVLNAGTGVIVARSTGTKSLRATADGHGEVMTAEGPVKILSPVGMLERVLSPDYLAK